MPYKVLDRRKGSWLVQIQRDGKRITRRGSSGGAATAKQVEADLLAELDGDQEPAVREGALDPNEVGSSNPPARARRRRRGKTVAAPRSPTLRDYFETRWTKHAMVVQNEGTRRTSRNPFNYILYYLGDQTLQQAARPASVNRFIEAMKVNGPISFSLRQDGTPRKHPSTELKNATINKSLQCLKAVLNLAHAEGALDDKPRLDLLPQDDSHPVLPPSEVEYHALLDACEDFREVAPLLPEVVEFTALTGLRRGEVFNLRWASVELDRQVIRVESHRRGRTVNGQAWRPKHGKWREVPLEPGVVSLLQRIHDQVHSIPDDFVFPNRGGAPYARLDRAPDASGKGYFPDAVAAAGLGGKVTFHSLRHLYAVTSLLGGRSISEVSAYLGHSSIELTVKTYGRFSVDAHSRREESPALARLARIWR
jgi:integrase